MKGNNHITYLFAAVLLALLASSCSTQKNTGMSRWYHQTKTKYNIAFNGRNAFNEGLEQVEGHWSLLLPKGKYSIKSVHRMGKTEPLTYRNEQGGTRIFLPSRPTTDVTDYVLEATLN